MADGAAQIGALRGGQIDVATQLPLREGTLLSSETGIELISVPSGAHHQVHMRTDMEPFRDPRVRRAVALCLDRPLLVDGLTGGHASIGNDSPFAVGYPSTDKSIPQRSRDIAEAKQLLAAAGMKDGFKTVLTTEKFLEIPDYGRAIQAAAKEIGGQIDLEMLEQGAYFADGVYGKSPWLDSPMGITDYDHRGLPNVCLTASLGSDGAWNAARYRNPVHDRLVNSYIAALDIDTQRRAAGDIEKLLLSDTPVIFAYFHHVLTAMRKGTSGVRTTASGQLLLADAAPPN